MDLIVPHVKRLLRRGRLIYTGEYAIYIAHLAVGLAAKTRTDKVSLWVPLVLAYTNDILKFGFFALGLEHSSSTSIDIKQGIPVFVPGDIPWSHGLLMSVVWSVLASVIIYLICRDRRTAIVMGLVVLSHWALDFIVHPPELPIFLSGSPKVGLGLWMSSQGFIVSGIIEIALLLGGLALYLVHFRRRMRLTISMEYP